MDKCNSLISVAWIVRLKFFILCMTLAGLSFGSASVSAQDWGSLPSLNNNRFEMQAVQYEENLYVFNGFGLGLKVVPTVEMYDATLDTWSVIGATSVAFGNALTHSGVVRIGEEVWIIGGRLGDHPGPVISEVWIFDLVTHEWAQGPSLPVPFAGGGAALVAGKIHVFGGLDPQANCDVANHFVIDPNNWQDITNSAPMPVPRNHFATVVHEEIIYTIGGQFGHDACLGLTGSDTDLVHAYNSLTDEWVPKASMPFANSHIEPSTFSYEGFIYVVTGETVGDKVLRYDPANDSWLTVVQLPEPLVGPVARVVGDRLIVAGGGAPSFANPIDTTRELPVSFLSVNGGTSVLGEGESIVELEAEVFDEQNNTASHAWVTNNLAGASNNASVVTTPDNGALSEDGSNSPRLGYFANFDQIGTWFVWVRGWGNTNQQGEGSSDSVHIGLNGQLVEAADKIDQFPPGWHWSNHTRDGVRASIEVPSADMHVVDMWMREDGLSVDKIVLTTDPNFIPTGQHAGGGAPVVAAGADESLDITETLSLSGSVTYDGLPSALTIAWSKWSGPGTVSFGASASLSTTVAFDTSGTYILELSANDGQYTSTDQLEVLVTDSATSDEPVWRLNVGGGLLPAGGGSNDWLPDAGYVNTGTVFSTTQSIDTSSVPSTVPSALFQTERWDQSAAPEMMWSLPLASGNYEVRMYFAEIYPGAFSNESRVFDVKMEGVLELDNVDVYGEAGPYKALMKTVPVTVTDGVLEIEILHGVENPAVKGIEVINAGSGGPSNVPPLVEAGAGQSADLATGGIATVSGMVTDDGFPSGALTIAWSTLTGPATATFDDSTVESTTVTFTAVGSYVLELSASDGQYTITDQVAVSVTNSTTSGGNVSASTAWQIVSTDDSSTPTARHEGGGVSVGGRLYILGGRGIRPVEMYDPVANVWTNVANAPVDANNSPVEINHFQPVAIGSKIYVMGSFSGLYPNETIDDNIRVFDTSNNQWSIVGSLPPDRLRASSGAVTYGGKIYLLGGSTNGHNPGAVAWFDEYDPQADPQVAWTALADARDFRDHFHAVVVGDKLIAAGGRRTAFPNNTFGDTVSPVSIYDFSAGAAGEWVNNGADIPTPRAGVMAVSYGTEAIIIGGEIAGNTSALNIVEAYDVDTNTWRTLQPMMVGRHGSGSAIVGDSIHVASGALMGGNETQSHEKLPLSMSSENTAPVVDAGPGQSTDLAISASVTLSGTVTDADLPPDTLTIGWSKMSGPEGVTIGSSTAASTTVTFTVVGNYVFELFVSDGQSNSTDQVVVSVTDSTTSYTPVFRINAGGGLLPAGGGSDDWLSDADYVNTGSLYSTTQSIDTSGLLSSVPPALFQTERWDGSAGPEMQWAIPVTPGNYEVRLYFAEIYSGLFGVGSRVFDVDVEGQILSNLDVFAEVGSFKGLMKTFTVASDNVLNITLSHVVENPAIKGIEILSTGGSQNMAPEVLAGADYSLDLANTNMLSLSGTASDDDLPSGGALTTQWSSAVSNPGMVNFSDASSLISIAEFSAVGSYTLRLTGNDGELTSSDTLVVTVTDSAGGTGGTSVLRINAGGPLLNDSGGDWVMDDVYVNTGSTYSTSATIDTSTISGVPEALFKTELWDGAATPEMQWAIPVTPGVYEVRLYFAEIFSGSFDVGSRVFDVNVEGQILSNLDVFSEVGSLTGLMKTFTVASDNVLNITLSHIVENPAIKGIEILTTDGSQNTAPQVSAGTDESLDLANTNMLSLSGNASDDDLPSGGALTTLWSGAVGNPGTVMFDDASSPTTIATFPVAGSYLLKLSATDGQYTSEDQINITVSDFSGGGGSIFNESNGLVVMEVESVAPEGDWSFETSIPDYTGTGYYVWRGPDHFPVSTAGDGTTTYHFRINNPGNYEFRWRSRIAVGTNHTEHNDNWARFSTGVDVPGQHPLEGKWTKVFQNQLNTWSWQATTVDNVALPLRQYFSAGDHTLEISGRSNGHGVDRMVLFEYDSVSFSAGTFNNLPESSRIE